MLGKGGMKEAPAHATEAPQGLEPQQIRTRDDLEKYWSEIKDLSANALDTGEGQTYGEREADVKADHLFAEYLKSGEHGELYVLLKNGRVVAFLALKKAIGDREAEIEQLRLVMGPDQGGYISEIMEFAKEKLGEEGYHHGVVDSDTLNERFASYASRVSGFLHVGTDESPEQLAA